MSSLYKKIKVDKITTTNGFFQLENDWKNILERNNQYNITNTWEWNRNWIKTFDISDSINIITISIDGEVVGIAPFYIKEVKLYQCIKYKQLRLVASGENEADEICSDYLDIIVDNEYRNVVIDELCNYIKISDKSWDIIILSDVFVDSPNIKCIIKTLGPDYIIQETSKSQCPYIVLPTSFDILKKSTRINSKEQLHRKERLLKKEGNVEFTVYEKERITEEVYIRFVQLHQKRWARVGKPGCFISNKFDFFHKTLLLGNSINTFRPVLYFLALNNKDLAARYCLIYRDHVYDYQSGQDPDMYSNLSPGLLLLSNILEDCICSGFKIYDFFKGKRGGYKYRWTEKEKNVATYVIIKRKHWLLLWIKNLFRQNLKLV